VELKWVLLALVLVACPAYGFACPLEDASELDDIEAMASSDEPFRTWARSFEKEWMSCVSADASADEVRAARILIEARLEDESTDGLRQVIERALMHPRARKDTWRVVRARLRAATGQKVFFELESLHGRGALSDEPEALKLLAAARREAGDVKGAGRIAVEARAAEKTRAAARARALARKRAHAVSHRAR